MGSLLDHAKKYQNYYNTIIQNSLFKKLAKDKACFKDLVEQYIDAGGLMDELTGLKAKSFNRVGEERITKKIEEIYKKHKREETSGNLIQLAVDIKKSATALAKAYEKIDGSSFVTPEGVAFNHRDFREVKERFVSDVKAKGHDGWASVRKQLEEEGINENIILKVKKMTR